LGVRIISTGKALPNFRVDNDRIKELVDTDSEWIVSRTGIEARHVALEETGLSLAARAARQALEGNWAPYTDPEAEARAKAEGKTPLKGPGPIDPDSIGLIVFATVSPDALVPCMASLLKREMNLQNAVGFDLNAACSGFIFGTWTAESLMRTSGVKRALVVGCERLSRITNWTDRGTCILFGDGAGAAVLELDDDKPGIIGIHTQSYDDTNDVLTCGIQYLANPFIEEEPAENYLKMNGTQVFRFAVGAVPEVMEKVIAKTGIKLEDIDYVVPHQANIRIINNISQKYNIPLEKFQISIENTGNTSAASVPMALDDLLRTGKVKEGDKLLLVGFGGGLSAGAMILEF